MPIFPSLFNGDLYLGPKLIFLPFAIALAQFPPPPMEDRSCELVPFLMAIELEQHAAPDGFLINIG